MTQTGIRSIISEINEPAYNLAAEELMLREHSGDFNFFYINKPSVIIGKHQNAMAEIDQEFLQAKNIPLFRRLSGGGSVFHDQGNLNFCFVRNGQSSELVNFKAAITPVVEVLNSIGVPAVFGERNDLLVNFRKISGVACHVYKQRVMHHGTLLFSTDLNMLTACLKSDPARFRDKAVKSVRSMVMNISEIYKGCQDAKGFMEMLEARLSTNLPGAVRSGFLPWELERIHALGREKYISDAWNCSYGPPYLFRKRVEIKTRVFFVELQVTKGVIESVVLRGNDLNQLFVDAVTNAIVGKVHSKEVLLNALNEIEVDTGEILPRELVSLFF